VAASWGGWPREQLEALSPDALLDAPDQIPAAV